MTRILRSAAAAAALAPAVLALVLGCADEAGKASAYDRSEKALKDPMRYSPGFEKRPPADAGAIGRPEKDGLGRDLDHVFNP